MGKESPSVKQTLSAAKAGTTLRIHYPETTVLEAAANLTVAASKPTPTLSMSAAALKSAPGTKYLAVSIDLDAPFPSFAVLGPALHGLHVDLVAGAVDADGFAPLEGTAQWLVPYVGPGPPKPSAPHRYVFMVFEQPEGMDAAKIKSVLGFGQEVGLMARIRWDEEAAEKKLGLGEAVAGNYFLTRA